MKLTAGQAITLAVITIACGSGDPEVRSERVTIPRGATLSAVAESLHAHRVIRSPRLFTLYATASGKQRDIQAGTFEFALGSSMGEVLETLVSGTEVLQSLIIPEGLMLSELAQRVHAQLGVDTLAFLDAARDSSLLDQVSAPAENLEGYLYPSTYYVASHATALDIVRQMATEFESRWRSEWNSRLVELGMTRHEIVILASIIEGEVRYRPDGKFVSSVYHNRLSRRMRLQADPTIIYALGRRRRLYQRDYQIESPYNTYLIYGLPPGPISQPSEASLEAALFPANTDFLYFVARPDGKHIFSRTHREHLAAVREVRRLESDSRN
ncbi:MAG: endolytic transglycosylase MltG [Gemmatimonadota bacterium]|nr:MAG: endolytic transglycosylase MltG [Gemmatimonadota bacterium]